MDLHQLYEPIVVAKPVKGRELRTTVIAKDGIGATIRAIPEEITTERAKDDSVEIYHEGYIDGKLYLVPDSNLQMMRDIVNLKMRRRLSSQTKPHTSLDEPNQYHEFNFKLDTLLDKIDKLVSESSTDESVDKSQQGGEDTRSVASDEVTPKPSKRKKKKTLDKETTDDQVGLQTIDEQDERVLEEGKERELESKSIPPILDDRIKYKPVKQQQKLRDNSFTGTYLSSDMVHGTKAPSHSVNPVLKYKKTKSPSNDKCSTDMETEMFNLLISGHIKHGKTPIFIIQHCDASNVLGNQKPDFTSHKKKGNIDIFIKGKFFTEDILEEDSTNSPSVININKEKLSIDKRSKIHKDKFRDIFSIGPVDIALEGEFLTNEYTLKCTPVLSLEIHDRSLEDVHEPPSTNVLFSREVNVSSPFEETGQESSECDDVKRQNHVHYTVDSENNVVNKVNEEKELEPEPKRKGLLRKMYTKIFLKKVDQPKCVSTLDKRLTTSSSQIRQRVSRNKRDRLIFKGRAREKLNRRRNTQSYDTGLLRVNSPVRVYRGVEEIKTYQHDSISKTEAKTYPKLKKRKKRDKNQTIIENPILAQMQEFFIT